MSTKDSLKSKGGKEVVEVGGQKVLLADLDGEVSCAAGAACMRRYVAAEEQRSGFRRHSYQASGGSSSSSHVHAR